MIVQKVVHVVRLTLNIHHSTSHLLLPVLCSSLVKAQYGKDRRNVEVCDALMRPVTKQQILLENM